MTRVPSPWRGGEAVAVSVLDMATIVGEGTRCSHGATKEVRTLGLEIQGR